MCTLSFIGLTMVWCIFSEFFFLNLCFLFFLFRVDNQVTEVNPNPEIEESVKSVERDLNIITAPLNI